MLSADVFEIKRLALLHEGFKIPVQLAHPSRVSPQTLWSEMGYQKKSRNKKVRRLHVRRRRTFSKHVDLPGLELI